MEYDYLLSALMGLPVVMLAFVLGGKQSRQMLVSGCYLTLISPMSVFYQERYWSATRLFGGSWGVEDLLFCFSFGSVVYLMAIWPYRRAEPALIRFTAGFVVRFGLLSVVGIGAFFIAMWAGAGVLVANLIANGILVLVLVLLRPRLLELGLRAAAFYTPYYFLYLSFSAVVLPNYMTAWDGPDLLGPRIFSIPVDEILWVVSFALVFPVCFAFNFDLFPPDGEKTKPSERGIL